MKKSLTLKRTLLALACLAMVLVAGVTLAACGGPGTNDYITKGENASFSNSDVKGIITILHKELPLLWTKTKQPLGEQWKVLNMLL